MGEPWNGTDRRVGSTRGGDAFSRFIGVVVAGALVAGVSGLWVMNASLARLEERVSNWSTIFEERFEQTTSDLQDMDRRLDALERVR